MSQVGVQTPTFAARYLWGPGTAFPTIGREPVMQVVTHVGGKADGGEGRL